MTRFEMQVNIPMYLPSLPNLRQMPLAGAATKKSIRKVVGSYLLAHGLPFRRLWNSMKGNPKFRLQVTLVRAGPQELDDDNNVGAFKPVRDELARFFDLDDKSKRFAWHYAQSHGGYEVRLHVEVEEDAYYVHVAPKFVEPKKELIKALNTPHPWSRKPTPNVRKPR